MDAKRALEEANGDMKAASTILREKGVATAAKRADRETRNGVIDSYIHAGGRIGVLVEVNCETDFVARTDDFRKLAHDIAMQVAATNPRVIGNEAPTDGAASSDEISEEETLLKQPFIKDPSMSVQDLVKATIAKTGENIVIRRFARFELGI